MNATMQDIPRPLRISINKKVKDQVVTVCIYIIIIEGVSPPLFSRQAQ